jgi:beta-glucosidase
MPMPDSDWVLPLAALAEGPPAPRASRLPSHRSYSILDGATWHGRSIEPVGAAFNHTLLSDVLRGEFGFRGLIVSDWAITNDCTSRCRDGVAAGERPSFADVGMPWGMEDVPKRAPFVKAVAAGVDQFGGTEEAAMIVEAVRAGEIAETRLNASVQRVMALKFSLGLFENPYVDAERAGRTVGTDTFRAAGLDAQHRALVLLENRGGILPLKKTAGRAQRVYLIGVDSAAARAAGLSVVADPSQADVAIARLEAPFETPHPGWVFGAMQHEGSLAFRAGVPAYDAFVRVSALVPTIAVVYLDRPAILTPVRDRARALVANFGVSDAALLAVLTGRAAPEGNLPFELPSSMAAVEAQRSDVPYDSRAPLYPFGFGRRY